MKRAQIGLLLMALAVALGAALFWVRGSQPAANPLPAAQSGHAFTFKDDVGRAVTVDRPLRRVVIFNRYDVEFVRAIAGTGPIVGVDGGTAREKAYWPELANVAIVGQGQATPNYDAIAALRPDLVILPRNGSWQEAERVLTPLHIPVAIITAWDVLKHEENATLIGQLFDKPQEAAELNAFYRHWANLLEQRLKGVKHKRVYMEEVADYRTLLPGSGWHDMIETGGGINVFRDVSVAGDNQARGSVQGFTVDPEEVIARAPDVILKLQPGQYAPHPRAFSRAVLTGIADRPGFANVPAIRNGQVYHMSYYLAGGCSKIIGALQVAKWLYPERFADVDPEAVMAEWLTRFQHVPAAHGYTATLREFRR
ncbi:MAG TPA: ABC transporter substrate-binding protein [Sphingobium sp.]|nr:ABC transporter substrate-binding protein [Sphingobium sp.]